MAQSYSDHHQRMIIAVGHFGGYSLGVFPRGDVSLEATPWSDLGYMEAHVILRKR
ncbi:MAG: hypothetical protein J2P54_22860 [Bradyrhizobiaceae bacterium]|nr:hypothetical protein [Bradyrhizobiaceae bacterium]